MKRIICFVLLSLITIGGLIFASETYIKNADGTFTKQIIVPLSIIDSLILSKQHRIQEDNESIADFQNNIINLQAEIVSLQLEIDALISIK